MTFPLLDSPSNQNADVFPDLTRHAEPTSTGYFPIALKAHYVALSISSVFHRYTCKLGKKTSLICK